MAYSARKITFFGDHIRNEEFEQSILTFEKEQWLTKHSFENEKELFHYSNLIGIKGIIESRELWFSHINCMNDPMEIEYGKEIVSQNLDKRLKEEDSSFIRTFLYSIKINVMSFGNLMHQPYLACFCESEKVLSQWRSYGESGKGYCLGFRFSENTKILPNKNNTHERYDIYLRKIIYSNEEQ